MFSPIHQTRLFSEFEDNSFFLSFPFLLLNEGLARDNLLVIRRVGDGLYVLSETNKAAYSVLCACTRTILPATSTVDIYSP